MLIEISSDTYKLYFNGLAVLPHKKIAYGSSSAFNGLFEIALESGKCTYIGMFPNEELYREYIHLSAVYCRQKAFFFPQRGSGISVYDIEEKNFMQIDLKECDAPYYSANYKIGQVFAHKNKVFAVGATYPYVIVIDADTLETRFVPIETEGRPIFFRTGGCQVGERYYVPSLKGGIVLEIDPETEDVKTHFWGTEEDGTWSMTFDGEQLWLMPHAEKGICLWEPEKGIVREMADFPKGYQAGNQPYVHCYGNGHEILCLPFDANMMIKADTKAGTIKKIEQSFFLGGKISGISFLLDSYVFFKIRSGEESWYAQTGRDLVVDLRTMKETEYAFVFAKNREQFAQDAADHMRKTPMWNNIMRENEKFGLPEFLKVLSR